MGSSDTIALVDQINDLLLRGDKVFSETLNLNFLVPILEDLQHLVIVKQVIDLATINFIHRHSDSKVALIILPIVDTAFEQVLNGQILQALHREGLA